MGQRPTKTDHSIFTLAPNFLKTYPRRNWVQTKPGKGWFAYIRLYGPEKAYFDKTWIPGDAEKMN
jgi:hypothetical protein